MDRERLSRSRILLVDDEADNLTVVAMVLRTAGAEVLTASNGIEGLMVFRQSRPDLVLTDLRMPGVNGWTLLEAIRAQAGEALPVIAMTAYAGEENQKNALRAGFTGYLLKPLNLPALLDDLVQITSAPPGNR
jgi:CheY-like chemotaxis protein